MHLSGAAYIFYGFLADEKYYDIILEEEYEGNTIIEIMKKYNIHYGPTGNTLDRRWGKVNIFFAAETISTSDAELLPEEMFEYNIEKYNKKLENFIEEAKIENPTQIGWYIAVHMDS